MKFELFLECEADGARRHLCFITGTELDAHNKWVELRDQSPIGWQTWWEKC